MNTFSLSIFITELRNANDIKQTLSKLTCNSSVKRLDYNDFSKGTDETSFILLKVPTDQMTKLCDISRSRKSISFILDENFKLSRLIKPIYCGWFFSDTNQNEVLLSANLALKTLFSSRTVLQKVGENLNYYKEMTNRFHVTSWFLPDRLTKLDESFLNYSINNFGASTKIYLKGFLLTKRTFSGHISLNQTAKSLFYEKKLVDVKPHVTLYLGGSTRPVQSGLDEVQVQNMLANGDYLNKQPIECHKQHLLTGQLYDCDDGNFYWEFNQPITYKVIFAPFYGA